jgi:hypothetical protein
VSAAVASTTVESAAVTAADEPVGFAAAIAVTTVAIVATASRVAVPVVTVAIIPATVETAAIVAVEPGAGSDEDSSDEIVRPVVAVRSAGVRIVTVVTVGADGCRANRAVDRAHSNGQANLGVGTACGKKQNSQQCCIF